MGGIINEETLLGLQHEKRMYLLPWLTRWLKPRSGIHVGEIEDLYAMMSVKGLESFSEHLDDKHASLLVYDFEKISPFQKKVLVDNENERLFKRIYEQMEGDTLVAIVNQWHVPAIEYFWRHSTMTEEKEEFINPIGDMDINLMEEGTLINELQRKIHSRNVKSEPSVTSSYLLHYHKL